MKVLPSIEALTAPDDSRLLAELELRHVIDELAQVRSFVERADHLVATVLACDEHAEEEPALEPPTVREPWAALRRPAI